ncbi:MAG: nucleotidyltransferase [Oscillospiraceae bacterium]
MKVFGIICEYNPFHNGHKFHLDETRKLGATHIISVMSGNFVQRGEPALADKFERANFAVKSGRSDLVIELPTAFSVSSAEYFARGAVSILSDLGCVDAISFGSECGDISLLKSAAKASADVINSTELIALLEKGMAFPAAVERLVGEKFSPEITKVFSSPNNLLGIEYIKAIACLNADISPFAVARKAVGHDENSAFDGFASASMIRRDFLTGDTVENLLPDDVFSGLSELKNNGNIVNFEKFEQLILYKFRLMSVDEISNLPDVSHGLENRIFSASKQAKSYIEFLELIKTKRYTMAKIRRILTAGLLELKKSDQKILPPFARVLAMNEKGCEILKIAKKSSKIPISTSLLKLSQMGEKQRIFAENDARATDIYGLLTDENSTCGKDFTAKIVKK